MIIIKFFALLCFTVLMWEVIIRFYYRIKKKSVSFSITNHTLLDNNFDVPDCYTDETWFEQYMVEAKKIFRHMAWEPYVYWRAKSFHSQYINIHADGHRKTWNKVNQGKELFTVYMFGGSTVWGWGARDEYTIPSWVSKMLNQKLPTNYNISVVNCGQLGYVSTQEVFSLIKQLKTGSSPSFVVFYDGLNDIFSAYQSGIAGLPQNELDRKQVFEKSGLNLRTRLIQKKSYLYQLVNARMDSQEIDQSIENYFKIKQLAQEVSGIYFKNIEIISALADHFMFDHLNYWQPILFTKKTPSHFEQGLLEHHQFWKPLADEVAVCMARSRIETNCFFNINHLLDDQERTLFIDPWHLSETGNEIVARRISEDILASVNVRMSNCELV